MIDILALLTAFEDDTLEWTDFLEILAVLKNLKKLARVAGSLEKIEKCEQLAFKLGLSSQLAPFHFKNEFSTHLHDNFGRVESGFPGILDKGFLFIGRNIGAKPPLDLSDGANLAKTAAKLYGYPSCCASAYQNYIQSGEKLWLDVFLAGLKGVVSAPWRMNRIGRLFAPWLSLLPDYFPCSVFCKESLLLACEYEKLLNGEFLCLADALRQHLMHPVLRHGGCLYWLQENRLKPSSYIVLGSIACGKATPIADGAILTIEKADELRILETPVHDRNALLLIFS